MVPAVRELGIGFVAYSPLGRGFLTGRFHSPDDLPADDFRRSSPRFQDDNFGRNYQLVEQVQALAAEKGVAAAQLALAWVLARGRDVVPIPGTKRRAYLEENVAALDVDLSPQDLSRLEEAVPTDGVAGQRYPDMSLVNR